MRRASFYIGAIVLGTAGGYAVASWALEVLGTHSTITEIETALTGALGGWMGLLAVIALCGIFVATVESRAMAVSILGARLADRPIGVRTALARSRATFWRIVLASLLVALPVGAAQGITALALDAIIPNAAQLSLALIAIVAALVGAPFAYLLTGIVLGDVDPFEAMRRSFRVFGARRRAAVLVALFESLAQLLILLGVSAGLDIVLRVFSAMGLSVDSGAAGLVLATIMIVVGVFAAGTLVFTVTALSIAPQVVMFVALTHATIGLDHVRPGGDRDPDVRTPGQPRFRRFTRPMLLGFVLAIGGLLGALSAMPG
jgi:succinate dehydrogenase hydrophobic anchor subunit